MKKFETKGECFGVKLCPRRDNDDHIVVKILVKDDTNWFDTGCMFSSSWIDEVIEQLQIAKTILLTQEPDIYNNTQYGYKFKNKD